MQPVVIIGAPRSGTNMLRDVLTSLPRIGTWPCDEINYIWRHGNVSHPSDEIPPERALPDIKRYIRHRFEQIARQTGAGIVVEKTCANSLRVPFVSAVLPEARYIYIFRDGIDATGSARLRWTAALDVPYLLAKVRYVPLTDLPWYGLLYFWSRLYRLFSGDRRLAFWGPKLQNMDELLRHHTLNEVCALQWQACVEKAEQAFAGIPPGKIHRVRYEDFVSRPGEELGKVLDFLSYPATEAQIESAVSAVSAESLGKGRQALGAEEVKQLEGLVGGSLERYGYR